MYEVGVYVPIGTITIKGISFYGCPAEFSAAIGRAIEVVKR